jgi:hypothetical protein
MIHRIVWLHLGLSFLSAGSADMHRLIFTKAEYPVWFFHHTT